MKHFLDLRAEHLIIHSKRPDAKKFIYLKTTWRTYLGRVLRARGQRLGLLENLNGVFIGGQKRSGGLNEFGPDEVPP